MATKHEWYIVDPTTNKDLSGPYSSAKNGEQGLLALNHQGIPGLLIEYLTGHCNRCKEPWGVRAGMVSQHGCGNVWDDR